MASDLIWCKQPAQNATIRKGVDALMMCCVQFGAVGDVWCGLVLLLMLVGTVWCWLVGAGLVLVGGGLVLARLVWC